MLPWIIGGAALSIAGGISQNNAIAKNANDNAKATAKMLLQKYDVDKNTLLNQAREVNNQVGMELTELGYKGLSSEGTAVATLGERNITGNTALRQIQNIAIKKEIIADNVVQNAESKIVDIQNQLRSAKYSYESGSMQNVINYNNTMSQQSSTLSLLAGGISTGLAVGSAAKSLKLPGAG